MTNLSIFLLLFTFSINALAQVALPNCFGDHMVLQRGAQVPVWGTANPGEKVTVAFAGQTQSVAADADGKWRVKLDPMPASRDPRTMTVTGSNTLRFQDVLVGEVWLCSGQSNMKWPVMKSNHAEVEIASTNFPEIRLLTVPNVASQQPLDNFEGQWAVCSPDTVESFSAVGYFFGRRLHNTLGVPIGLINNAWGGSAAEAWLSRETLIASGICDDYIAEWDKRTANYTDEVHARKMAEFRKRKAEGTLGNNRRAPRDPRGAQQRPANLYNGVLRPILGYSIRGAIWYQGESNASRGYDYRKLFPLMISTWRKEWQQGDFPFYWVQLADFREEATEAIDNDAWAELRESQTLTLALPKTGQAVIIDAGEGRDIHPRDKQTVANRLVRHALVKDYGFEIACESPRFKSVAMNGNTATVTFDFIDQGLYAFDTKTVHGFYIAGEDKKFVLADAKISGKKTVKVSSPNVPTPVAVRYGWAQNPIVNLYDRNGLPVTPFRTDSWPAITNN